MGDGFSVPFGLYEIQLCSGLGKIEQRRDAANEKAADGAPGCPNDAHIHPDDENIVEKDIGQTCCNTQPQPQIGFPCGDEKGLKHGLYDRNGVKRHHDFAVIHAIGQQVFIGSQKQGKGAYEQEAGDGNYQTDDDAEGYDEGESTAGFRFFSFAQFAPDDGGAPCPQHDAQPNQDIDEGKDDIDGGEGSSSHKAGNENAVHDGIGCHKHQHDDGGQGEFYQG